MRIFIEFLWDSMTGKPHLKKNKEKTSTSSGALKIMDWTNGLSELLSRYFIVMNKKNSKTKKITKTFLNKVFFLKHDR